MAQPDISLQAFPLQVAAWKNEREGRSYWSVKLTKAYKDQSTNEWRSTEYLAPADLPVAGVLLNEVWRKIAVEERSPTPATTVEDGNVPY